MLRAWPEYDIIKQITNGVAVRLPVNEREWGRTIVMCLVSIETRNFQLEKRQHYGPFIFAAYQYEQ